MSKRCSRYVEAVKVRHGILTAAALGLFGGLSAGCGGGDDVPTSSGAGGSGAGTTSAGGTSTSSTTCPADGVCTPGTIEVEACAFCGERQRVCNPECQYGDWDESQCTGECAAGAEELGTGEGCGPDATQDRRCSDTCVWETTAPCTVDCSTKTPPAGWNVTSTANIQRAQVNLTATTYEEAFGPFPIDPNLSNSTNIIRIGRTTILSWPVTIPQDAGANSYAFFTWTGFINTTSTRVTVSHCRGGIDDPVPQAAGKSCIGQGGNPGGDLSFGPGQDAKCVLGPGDYWFNIAHIGLADEMTCDELGGCDWRGSPLGIF